MSNTQDFINSEEEQLNKLLPLPDIRRAAKNLRRAEGGSLIVNSEEGNFTEFVITLPV